MGDFSAAYTSRPLSLVLSTLGISIEVALILFSIGKGEMGFQGLTGVGVGCVCSSAGPPPGSRKEKKLCESECLWWCPRLAGPDGAADPNAGSPFPASGGGFAPNVKPFVNER